MCRVKGSTAWRRRIWITKWYLFKNLLSSSSKKTYNSQIVNSEIINFSLHFINYQVLKKNTDLAGDQFSCLLLDMWKTHKSWANYVTSRACFSLVKKEFILSVSSSGGLWTYSQESMSSKIITHFFLFPWSSKDGVSGQILRLDDL